MKNLMWKSLVALTLLSAPVHASVVSETTCYSDGVNGIGVTWADMPGLQNASTSTELTAA